MSDPTVIRRHVRRRPAAALRARARQPRLGDDVFPVESTPSTPRDGARRREDDDVADPLQTQVTRLLHDLDGSGESDAAQELLGLVYDQLHAIARRRMGDERASHTLQATALVNEAYLKLIGGGQVSWASRGHFYAVAAEAMRRILIDHARRRDSRKRGGGRRGLPLSVVDLATEHDADGIEALHEALTTLEREDARAAQVVKLRFYAGLSADETADVMGISRRTVMREWAFARARLYELLEPDAEA